MDTQVAEHRKSGDEIAAKLQKLDEQMKQFEEE